MDCLGDVLEVVYSEPGVAREMVDTKVSWGSLLQILLASDFQRFLIFARTDAMVAWDVEWNIVLSVQTEKSKLIRYSGSRIMVYYMTNIHP